MTTITNLGAKRLRTKRDKAIAMLNDRATTAGEKANAQVIIERIEAQLWAADQPLFRLVRTSPGASAWR